MIDIHTHILPGLDDGSGSLEESVRMAKQAAESGVDCIIATPHSYTDGFTLNFYDDLMKECYESLKEAIRREQIPLEILLGMEVYASEEVPSLLLDGKLLTLNRSGYVLIELGFFEDRLMTQFLIDEITGLGYSPIIAHPERYPYVQKHPDIVLSWIKAGCTLQVNKGSILGNFGNKARKTSLTLLKKRLVSFVASDAHGLTHRTAEMQSIYRYLENNFSKGYAELLLNTNPRCVVENRNL